MRAVRLGAAILAALLGPWCAPVQAGGAGRDVPRIWSEGYTLVRLDAGADPHAAMRAVQDAGGTVAVVVPPRILMGWIPPQADAALLGHAGIRSLHRDAADALADAEGFDDPASRAATRSFARAVRGELETPQAVLDAQGKPAAGEMLPDARDRGDLSEGAILENLRAQGIGAPAIESALQPSWAERDGLHPGISAPGLAAAPLPRTLAGGNSDVMIGTVSVSLFFVESGGGGTDPNLYDWTQQSQQGVFDEAVAGLSWWSAQAKRRSSCWVTFYITPYFATEDTRCTQWREPVLHPSTDYKLVVSQVLGNFGYQAGTHLERATAFNVAQRIANGTDWAYSSFVAANPTGPAQFTDGYAAWAYVGGPYNALLQHSFTWPFHQVYAHESCHMFHSCDEYYVPGYGGCNDCGLCADSGVPNGNCERCNSHAVSCMMRSNAWSVCNFTAGQIGWWRNPCNSAAPSPPVLTAALPATLGQGYEASVELDGDHFVPGLQVFFGDGVQVQSVDLLSAQRLSANLHVDVEATPGPRDIVVTSAEGLSDTLAAAFRVRTTPLHFVSSTGGNVYPYDTPAGAATSLTTALAACSTGDTLLLTGGAYLPFEVPKGLVVEGGWTNDFEARNTTLNPSVVNSTWSGMPAVTISGLPRAVTLDGITLRGGSGKFAQTSELGNVLAGGGLWCANATVTLRNCRIEDNDAGTVSVTGLGGGAFLWHSTASLVNCVVRGNHAGRGAGIFVLGGEAHLQDVTLEANSVDAAYGPAWGAGLAAVGARVEMTGGVARNNLGANEGGGLHFESCPSVRLVRLHVDFNVSTGTGGGVLARGSRLVLEGCSLTRNVCAERGAGLHVAGDSLQVYSTLVAGNVAGVLGGGGHVTGSAFVLRNVTLARNSGGPASGLYCAGAAAAGSIRDCIVARNTLGGLVLGGGTAPALDWNDYFDNGGVDLLSLASGPHDAHADPLFANADSLDMHLGLHSPCIDSGDPAPGFLDPDGSLNDRGAFGGPKSATDAPPRVRGAQGRDLGGAVRLTWYPSLAPDLAWYVVYRDITSGMQPSPVNYITRVHAPNTNWIDMHPIAGAWYVVAPVDSLGHAGGFSSPVQATPPTDTVAPPRALALDPVWPNPTNPGAWIQFELPEPTTVRLGLYDTAGRRVRDFSSGTHGPGRERIWWDGRDDTGRPAASGVYWVRLSVPGHDLVRKVLVIR